MFRIEACGHDDFDLASLSRRQCKLVEAAANYNALVFPGRRLRFKVYQGPAWAYPRLTDDDTVAVKPIEDMEGVELLGQFEAISRVRATSESPRQYFSGSRQIHDSGVRAILISPDEASDEDVMCHHSLDSHKARLYKTLEQAAPVAFDFVREYLRSTCEALALRDIDQNRPMSEDEAVSRETSGIDLSQMRNPWVECDPGRRVRKARKAVIIGMYWLQTGGAERWGLETIALAKQAGLLPIVITDRAGHSPWIDRPECEEALVLPLSEPMQQTAGDAPLLRALAEQFDIRGVVIHHCQWMYDHVRWIKRHMPGVPVVDSLHIVEYLWEGGYPHEAVRYDNWIDLHHVISPQLERWLVDARHIDPDKVVVAPLVGLTADTAELVFAPRRAEGRLTVAFIGRNTRQKRPEAFVYTAKALEKARPGAFRFIMQGFGELDDFVNRLIERNGLRDVIELVRDDTPVEHTYDRADVLLVTSINEGLTLTTIEAIARGVPVLSARVGSQDTLVPVQGLLPRGTMAFVAQAKRSLLHVLESEADRHRLWQAEAARLKAFSSLESAGSLFASMFTEWSK